MSGRPPLIVACGALAGELRAVLSQLAAPGDVEVRLLPAPLHNRPERIVPALRSELEREVGRRVLVGYADCGTGGMLDAYLDESRRAGADVDRLPGAHCYEMFAGHELFAALQHDEPGTFYLTDFLARHFDALVWQGLGLDRHPELMATYFGNYRRVVLLSQSADADVVGAGRRAAEQLQLDFDVRHVGRAGLERSVAVRIERPEAVA